MSIPYTEQFKARTVRRLVGPSAVSAVTLAGEVGIPQPTLSRWLREAGTLTGVTNSKRRPEAASGGDVSPKQQRRPADWSAEERLRAVLEANGLSDGELGAFLRREGLHRAQLEQWRSAAIEALGARSTRKTPARAAAARRVRELEREVRRKDRALAEAAALLVLQKKVRALWADEDDDTQARSGS